MKIRHGLTRGITVALVVSMALLGMSAVAGAAKKGSPTWCAHHPGKAAGVASCQNSSSGSGAGGSGAGGSGGPGTTPDITVQIDPNPLVETFQSEITATVQVETSPSFAGDHVSISSSQLWGSCEEVAWTTLEGSTGTLPVTSVNPSVSVVLDDDGNATVFVAGYLCAPGSDTVEADLEVAPYYTALGTLTASPPVVTTSGLFGYPTTSGTVTTGEVETGDTTASGDSDVYAVFYVETDPVYAEQQVEISSAELEGRCGTGWTWASLESEISGIGVNTTQPPVEAMLDDDGNAVFVFLGSSCAAGTSEVIADVISGVHTTYTTTFTVDPPAPTI